MGDWVFCLGIKILRVVGHDYECSGSFMYCGTFHGVSNQLNVLPRLWFLLGLSRSTQLIEMIYLLFKSA